jgi:chromatin segregation and condensation protein Rec8/ScpA/Scc1 (kleisin family)
MLCSVKNDQSLIHSEILIWERRIFGCGILIKINFDPIHNLQHGITPQNNLNVQINSLNSNKVSDLFKQNAIVQESNIKALSKTLEYHDTSNTLSNHTPANISGLQKNRSLSYLIDENALNKVLNTNIWELNLRKTLSDLQTRLYDNPLIKFRIGGRAIYSASQIVRAKSSQTIEESSQTRDQMYIKESDTDDLGNNEVIEDESSETVNEIQTVNDEVVNQLTKNINKDNSKEKIIQLIDDFSELNANYEFNNTGCEEIPDSISFGENIKSEDLISLFPTPILYNEDKNGERYIKAPLREVARHSRFEDLTKALIKTLNYQLIKPLKSKRNNMDSFEDPMAILPENILKKAEDDRALVEEQISKMYEKIIGLNNENRKISFFDLIISPDVDGIVRTLLYVLHLVNRKKIQLWQESDEELNNSSNSVSNIIIKPV